MASIFTDAQGIGSKVILEFLTKYDANERQPQGFYIEPERTMLKIVKVVV